MVYCLKCPPRVEGDEEGAIIDGSGGRNIGAKAAIEGIIAVLEPPSQGAH